MDEHFHKELYATIQNHKNIDIYNYLTYLKYEITTAIKMPMDL